MRESVFRAAFGAQPVPAGSAPILLPLACGRGLDSGLLGGGGWGRGGGHIYSFTLERGYLEGRLQTGFRGA